MPKHNMDMRVMRTEARRLLVSLCLALAVYCIFPSVSHAHPEDEFCSMGSDIDPELCRALAELDAEAPPPSTNDLLVSLDRSIWENTGYFMGRGVSHILPGGTDHILFVLALFFAVRRLRPLLVQVSLFTLAHSVALGLAAAGYVYVPSSFVEPLIALSIGLVGLENIFRRSVSRLRPLIIFGFGLFHGLGFAGFFLDQQLPEGLFWSSLIGFNVGVELGQLSVILLGWLTLNWFFNTEWYGRFVALPASAIIACIGFWWAIQRTFLG